MKLDKIVKEISRKHHPTPTAWLSMEDFSRWYDYEYENSAFCEITACEEEKLFMYISKKKRYEISKNS